MPAELGGILQSLAATLQVWISVEGKCAREGTRGPMPTELGVLLESVVATLQAWRCIERVMFSAKSSIQPPRRTREGV